MLKDQVDGNNNLFNKKACFKKNPTLFVMYLLFDGFFRILFNLVMMSKLYLIFQNETYLKSYSIIFGIFAIGWFCMIPFMIFILYPFGYMRSDPIKFMPSKYC